MLDFFHSLYNSLIDFVANESYINFICTIFTAVLSYKTAKFTSTRPNKLKIKQEQFDKVYLPLYRLLEHLPSVLPRADANKLQIQIAQILEDGYEFAFPQLHILNQEFKERIVSNDLSYLTPLSSIQHQVNLDYALLRKQLGYPSESIFKIFIRMTLKQKIQYVFSWINVFAIFSPALYLPVQFKTFQSAPWIAAILIFVEIAITLFLIIKVNQFINDLPD